ncbi:HlyD family efflux transporter periplasmic adaptor subunit [Belnapia sp. T6]|uniref:HlyD family efflux transporter periplasmic adaptor subunit n=1 Tax=Belnapia mucosa TaxID=2804532 RepID=A0ABS1VA27_9PROT|nr:HlyD family efflux transporter periplasmic adaptor subunit [Belnapia mucosa]MBL6458520.1 HlyD family efflux transporter periplasmic adaptor subunit [Belnapia mucosa]
MTAGPASAGMTGGDAGLAAWRALRAAGDAQRASKPWLDLAVALVAGMVRDATGGPARVIGGFVALRQGAEARFTRTASFGQAEVSFALAKAAERCLQTGRSVAAGGEEASGQLAVPLPGDEGLLGVVALDIAAADAAMLDAANRLLQWGLGWFGRGLPAAAPALPPGAPPELLRAIGGEGDLAGIGEVLCTLLAERLQAMRVSLGSGTPGAMRPFATSRGRLAKSRTDFSVALAAAMEEAVEAAAPVAWPPLPGQLSPHGAQQRLGQGETAGWVLTLTCAPPEGGPPFLAAVIEGGLGTAAPISATEWQTLLEELAPLLALRLRAERGLLAHAGARLAETARAWVPPRDVTRGLIAAAVVGLVLAGAFLRIEYRVAAHATLEGAVRRAVTAPFDGFLADAAARPGDRVPAGTILARLDEREQRLQRAEQEGRLAESQRQMDEAIGRRDIAAASIAAARRQQAEAELHLAEQNLARASLAAPFDGIVIAGDPRQSLGAPLRRGDIVYELSPLDSWRVVLEVNETQFAAVEPGQHGRLLLSALPQTSYGFTVTAVTPLATAKEGHNSFRVEARLDEEDASLRPGMQGIGKIEAGPARLVWIASRSALTWLRLKLWAWLP